MTDPTTLRAAALVDHDALRHNLAVVRRAATPAEVWAVVKADAYGHGATAVARTLVEAGVPRLCVAVAAEGAALRRAGIEASILVLSEPPPAALDEMVEHRLTATIYTREGVDALGEAARRAHGAPPVEAHLKVDTGMHRVGCAPSGAVALAERVGRTAGVQLTGTWTHLARADEPDQPANALQLERFDAVLADLAQAGIDPGVVHAANSAGALALRGARRDAVRAGIALYGSPPGPGVAEQCADLRPVLSLVARVGLVRRVAAGEGVSYGHRWVAPKETTVATIPLGYADGVVRRLGSTGATVLIRGRHRPVVGSITMDQLMVDCGDDPVAGGEQAVLVGHQGSEAIAATEWAERLDTIVYEITCGISARVPRVHLGAAG